jgi:hypothetical protein
MRGGGSGARRGRRGGSAARSWLSGCACCGGRGRCLCRRGAGGCPGTSGRRGALRRRGGCGRGNGGCRRSWRAPGLGCRFGAGGRIGASRYARALHRRRGGSGCRILERGADLRIDCGGAGCWTESCRVWCGGRRRRGRRSGRGGGLGSSVCERGSWTRRRAVTACGWISGAAGKRCLADCPFRDRSRCLQSGAKQCSRAGARQAGQAGVRQVCRRRNRRLGCELPLKLALWRDRQAWRRRCGRTRRGRARRAGSRQTRLATCCGLDLRRCDFRGAGDDRRGGHSAGHQARRHGTLSARWRRGLLGRGRGRGGGCRALRRHRDRVRPARAWPKRVDVSRLERRRPTGGGLPVSLSWRGLSVGLTAGWIVLS